jgi:hypothetical protein
MGIRLQDTIYAYVESLEEDRGATLLHARTREGTIPLKLWRGDRGGLPKARDYLRLDANDLQAAERELQQYKSISLDSKYNKPVNYACTVVPESDIPQEVKELINRDRTPQILAAKRLLEDPSPWRDKTLHGLLLGFASENEKRLFNAPAAVKRHHNWRGGLLVHTAEVASYCLSILQSHMCRRDSLDGDALLLAAWMHDTGKMETYRMEGETPTIDGELEDRVGHPTISNLIFSDLARKNGLPDPFRNLVSHCILSHHERREWGAVVEPQTIEAHVLCRADYISSRMPG